jgi:eukaryotic-like serine/threonine-protein kinase
MDAERWQRLSPLLDAMFELEPEERARSLQLLREEDPQLAADLEELMALEEERADFLAEPLIAPLPGAHPGTIVGPWRLERMLGEGGMGQVWLGGRADGLYQRRVAIKLLRPGLVEPNLRLRFNREREILARLAHPHIARLLDAGVSHDGQPYLTLEYIEGEPITDWCRARLVSLETRLKLFAQVCAAVSHAHANLIVHRDLKPSNILVTPAGEVRLLDFGIAKLLDSDGPPPEQTRTGVRAFTLHYAAPEQIRGEAVTTMTDVYSLGVVLHELLSGARPYRLTRESDAAFEEAILRDDPQKPSQSITRGRDAQNMSVAAMRRHARALAGDLDNIVLKALAKRPEQRYPSVEALAQDLQRYAAGRPVRARPASLGYQLRKYVSRHRWPLATAGLGVAVLAAALGLVHWQARRALEDAARAQALQDFVLGLFEHAGNAAPGEALDLRQLLEAGVDRGNRELVRQPRARAELLGLVARLRLGLGDYDEASMLLDRQQMILESLVYVPPGLRLEAATLRGRSQRLLGDPHACIQSMQPWLDKARRAQSQLRPQAAEFQTQLGRCRRAVGETNAARQLFERALALRDGELGDDVGAVANLLDLAALHADAGDDRAALAGYQAALARLRRDVGERHPLAIGSLRAIGASQQALGRAAAAEDAYSRALALALDLHGVQHPVTLELRRQLAAAYVEQGRYAEAERELGEARRLLAGRAGSRQPELAAVHDALALAARERGNLPVALREQAVAISIRRQAGAQDALAPALAQQALLLQEAGRPDESLAALEEAGALLGARLGGDHPALGAIERQTGEALAAAGARGDALLRLQRAVALTRPYGADHPEALQAALALGRQQALAGQDPGLAALDRIAAIPGEGREHRRLRWRARAQAAHARCLTAQAARAAMLDAIERVIAEVRRAHPAGGSLLREIEGLRADCLSRGPAPATAAAPAPDRSGLRRASPA